MPARKIAGGECAPSSCAAGGRPGPRARSFSNSHSASPGPEALPAGTFEIALVCPAALIQLRCSPLQRFRKRRPGRTLPLCQVRAAAWSRGQCRRAGAPLAPHSDLDLMFRSAIRLLGARDRGSFTAASWRARSGCPRSPRPARRTSQGEGRTPGDWDATFLRVKPSAKQGARGMPEAFATGERIRPQNLLLCSRRS
jgi:hypothetical protein